MASWGWLLLGSLGTAVVVLLVILITRKPQTIGLSDEERKKLQEATAKDLEEKLKIEQAKQERLAALFVAQADTLKKIQQWYDGQKAKIEEDQRAAFEKYMADSDAAGAELDKLVGLSPEPSVTTGTAAGEKKSEEGTSGPV